MGKRLAALLSCCAIASVSLVCALALNVQIALAAVATSVTIDGTYTLNASNPSLNLGEGTISFDATTGVLKLENASIIGQKQDRAIRSSGGDLTIELVGDNYIDSSFGAIFAAQVAGGTLLITGDGSLTIEEDDYGISAHDANIIIDGCTLDITSGEGGGISSTYISGSGNIVVRNGANVSITSSSAIGYSAMMAYGDITVVGSTLFVDFSGTNGTGIFAYGGSIDIESSNVSATSTATYGIYATNDLSIRGGSVVSAAGPAGGDDLGGGNVTIDGSWVSTQTGVDGSPAISDSVVIEGDEGFATGNAVINGSLEVPAGVTLTIPENASVTVSKGAQFQNNGTVILNGGFVNEGTVIPCATGSHVGGAATCDSPAVCALCGTEYAPFTGHSWGKPAWSWSDDYTEFVATFTCANDPAHTEVLTARPTATVQAEPTCAEPGTMLYRASVELGGERYEATATAEIPAAGHAYVDGVCTVCGGEDPGYEAPEEPDPAVEREEEPAIPATGDASTFFSAVPALAGMSAIAAGAHFRRRR